MSGLESRAVSSMIQGVSQQAPQARRDSQCDSQFDCVNSPKYGVIPRPHFDYMGKLDAGTQWANAFFYEMARGTDEHYLAMVQGGFVKVMNLDTVFPCKITRPGADVPYFEVDDQGTSWANFCGQSVGDVHFIANRGISPAFTEDRTSTRAPEALLFFKAGDYSMTYKVYLTLSGDDTTYVWAYLTPDNSVAANKSYITTDSLATTFARAMTESTFQAPSGTAEFTGGDGKQSYAPAPDQGFSQTATELGYHIELSGNLVRITRDDGADFSVQVVDGNGGANLKGFKGTIEAFSDLPRGGFPGMRFEVRGNDQTVDTAYFVAYAQNTDLSFAWQEVGAPGIAYALDPDTMPWALANTGFNEFVLRRNAYGTRVAGDGVNNGKDPSFVGRYIQALFYYQGRLAILTESSCVWSKTLNPFVFFPDTVQTVQDSSPVDVTFTASGGRKNQGVSLLRQSVQVDEGLFLWASRNQFRVDSGNSPFSGSTVQSLYSTSYEFAEYCQVFPMGKTLYFATENGPWSTIRSLLFYLSRPQGDTDITAHVSAYVPSDVRDILASDALNCMFVRVGTGNLMYVYNFLISGNNVAQSAWNCWRLPPGQVAWASVYKNYLYVALQRDDGLHLIRADLSPGLTDPGHSDYVTRLDMRLISPLIDMGYDAPTNNTVCHIPYPIAEDLAAGRTPVAIVMDPAGDFYRGQVLEVSGVAGTGDFLLKGDLRGVNFAFGFTYTAERTESTFFLRSDEGVASTDKLLVKNFRVQHAKSAYYRIEVTGKVNSTYEFQGRKLGSSTGQTGAPQLHTGDSRVSVACENTECSIRLVNDTAFPSAWVASEYQFQSTIRAQPAGK